MSQLVQKAPPSTAAARPKFGNLPALPEVTFKILQLVKDPSSTPAVIQKLICSDVALSTRILKVANSVFYGLSRQVSSIDRAVVVLGRNAVRNIAVAASMVKIFAVGSRSDSGRFNARDLWMHSTATATAARIIADTLRSGDANELFLAGLTHDIGIMAEMHWSREKLLYCVGGLEFDSEGAPLQDLRIEEAALFGQDHQTLGNEVCGHWNFPDLISKVVGHHHSPLDLAGDDRRRACIIHLADLMTGGLPQGFRLDLMSLEIQDDVLDVLQLTHSQIAAIRERLVAEMDEVAQMLS
jgi:HD-like signal output (HDOD) protein